MIKIDLHAHTQLCKQGEGKKREISPEDFVKKMWNNQVGICSITNHNKFDLAEYNEIITIDPELIIFPGIELDVKMANQEHRHIILVSAPSVKNKFSEVFNEEDRDLDKFIIDYSFFIDNIKKFDFSEILIIPHFYTKDKDRGITSSEANKLRQDLNGYTVILEPKTIQSMGIINSHNDLSIFGSDVKDWNSYEQIILPEIKFRIDSFSKFYHLAKDPKIFIKQVLNDTTKYEIQYSDKYPKLENPIEIFEDINVIFGEKGSGKTILINDYIYPSLNNLGKNVVKNEGKDYDTAYSNLIESLGSKIKLEDEKKENIKKYLELILEYTEKNNYDVIEKIRNSHQTKLGNKKAQLIKKIDTTLSKGAATELNTIMIDEAHENFRKINEVDKINKSLQREKNSIVSLDAELTCLKEDIIRDLEKNTKEQFGKKGIISSLNSIKQSIKKQTGKESKPTQLGFSDLVSKRLSRIKNNNLLIEKLKDITSENNQKFGTIPKKGMVMLKTKISVLTEEDYHNPDSPFDKNGIGDRRKIMKKINGFSINKGFSNVNEYFSSEEKSMNIDEFMNKSIKSHSYTYILGEKNNEIKYEPSEGEKAILSISGVLENKQYDFYVFDEIERGLGNHYISSYLIPKIKELRDSGKTIIISTHNANIAINTLPSQTIYCNYDVNKNSEHYFTGNMYSNILECEDRELKWEEVALSHLEGNSEMFENRRDIYGI